jgi:CheY-like chemotaxis protein
MSRILVVDDEPIIRRFLADGLADAGHEVITATNGAEALDRVRERQSDIVLLDLLMPVMDGISFLLERQASPHLARLPVVVLTAGGIEALRIATRLRATAVLSKPLDLEALSTVIEHVLRQWPGLGPRPETDDTNTFAGRAPWPVSQTKLYPGRLRYGVKVGLSAELPEDRRSVHTIDEALHSASVHRLWQAALQCTRPVCNHGV